MVKISEAKKLRYGQTIYHKTLTNRDGTPLRARVSGKVKTWKTRPEEVKVPIKHGLYDSGYLTHSESHSNLSEWSLTEGRRKKPSRR